MEFTKFEIDVMNMLLKGDNITFKILREQFSKASVSSREFTGAGFFINFTFPNNIKKLVPERSFDLDNVCAKTEKLKSGIGFVLFINEGKIDFLEGYTYGEPFPDYIEGYKLYYNDQENQD